jgi:hypothetical protein
MVTGRVGQIRADQVWAVESWAGVVGAAAGCWLAAVRMTAESAATLMACFVFTAAPRMASDRATIATCWMVRKAIAFPAKSEESKSIGGA